MLLLLTRQQDFFSSIPSLFYFFNLDFYFFSSSPYILLGVSTINHLHLFLIFTIFQLLFSLCMFIYTHSFLFFPYSFTFLPLFYLYTFFSHSLYFSQPWIQQGALGLGSLDLSYLLLSQAENTGDRVLTVTCVVVFCVSVCAFPGPLLPSLLPDVLPVRGLRMDWWQWVKMWCFAVLAGVPDFWEHC